jgi:hypothetical protein
LILREPSLQALTSSSVVNFLGVHSIGVLRREYYILFSWSRTRTIPHLKRIDPNTKARSEVLCKNASPRLFSKSQNLSTIIKRVRINLDGMSYSPDPPHLLLSGVPR